MGGLAIEDVLDVPQMVHDGGPVAAPDVAIETLGDADAAEMLALAALTRPGYFSTRTHELGTFLGIRHEGRVIAMAGQRLHVPGFHEVTSVCTHPDYLGRGHGAVPAGGTARVYGHRGATGGYRLIVR
jgi:hypothetical protein